MHLYLCNTYLHRWVDRYDINLLVHNSYINRCILCIKYIFNPVKYLLLTKTNTSDKTAINIYNQINTYLTQLSIINLFTNILQFSNRMIS